MTANGLLMETTGYKQRTSFGIENKTYPVMLDMVGMKKVGYTRTSLCDSLNPINIPALSIPANIRDGTWQDGTLIIARDDGTKIMRGGGFFALNEQTTRFLTFSGTRRSLQFYEGDNIVEVRVLDVKYANAEG